MFAKKTALSDKELELKEMNMNKINDESFIEPAGIIIDSDTHGNYIYRVHVNGTGMGYKLIGTGEPLVMILGLGGTMDCWPQEVIKRLSEKYLLIIPDNRGMGYTTSGDETFTCKLLADDIISLLDALKVKKTHVLGFSMGSMIAQHLLLEHPERLNKVIIYATLTDISKSPIATEGNMPGDPAVRRQLDAILQWRTPMDKLPYVTNHVMLIVGTSDNVVGVESSKVIASAIPGAWLIQVKNATHLLMNELPVEFSGIVLMFLDETFEVKSI
ncbi:MAG: alpha/beta hydrolase [Candidatus Eremiobacterota bacterium]